GLPRARGRVRARARRPPAGRAGQGGGSGRDRLPRRARTARAVDPRAQRRPPARAAPPVPRGAGARGPRRGSPRAGQPRGYTGRRRGRPAAGASPAAPPRTRTGATRTTQPWHRHYDAGVPASLAPYPDKTLVDFLREHAARTPEASAILFQGTRLSYAELDRLSDRFAAGLGGLGLARGTRVGLLLPNCPQFPIAELGAWKAGATVVPINPIYTERELEHALTRTGCEAVVTLTTFHARLKAVQPHT